MRAKPGEHSSCTVEDCERNYYARGCCRMHYQRLMKFGTTDDPTPSLDQRFWSKVDVGDDDTCWPWLGGKDSHGYGQFNNRGAHRFAYEWQHGPIPQGLELDHLCHTRDADCPGGRCAHRSCVNPRHMEPVTLKENQLRSRISVTGVNAAKTHCIRGHEFNEANTRLVGGKRICQACKRGTFLSA